MTATRTPWTPAENAALVRLYFTMLDSAIAGQPYNKAAMIRDAQGDNMMPHERATRGELRNRSRGSIEAKLMNATAAHRDLRPGHETMDGHGYRALANYQAALGEAMLHAIQRRDAEADGFAGTSWA